MLDSKRLTPSVDRAHRYAREVIQGRILACKFVAEACRRHARDIKRSRDPEALYYFDTQSAERACRFIQKLPHTKGRWARVDRRNPSNLIRLEPWQCFIVCMIFGWRRRRDGLRRFRRVYLEIPRKNGKSLLAAAIGLYMFLADREVGAEVYSGATTEKQAWEVFRPARQMCIKRPALAKQFGIAVGAKTLSVKKSEARFEPVVGKPGDGASPHLAIVDEFHEHMTDALYETMETGMGAREQPLMFVITTAGEDVDGPCHALRGELVQVLKGALQDEEFFGIIYSLDPDDDWTTEDSVRKANPNADVSTSVEYLLGQVRKALNNPRRQGAVKTKHFNVWVAARDAFFDYERWQAAGDPELRLEDFEGDECQDALDIAYKTDFCSRVKVFRRGSKWFVFSTHYLPDATIDDPAHRHYQGWRTTGDLTPVDGEVNDLFDVEEHLLAEAERFITKDLAIDPYKARHFGQTMQDEHGFPVTFYQNSLRNMSEPMKEINALLLKGNIVHDGNLVMNWMMSNVVNSKKGAHAFPAKEREERKIDGPVALVMAMGRLLFAEDTVTELEYSRGEMFL